MRCLDAIAAERRRLAPQRGARSRQRLRRRLRGCGARARRGDRAHRARAAARQGVGRQRADAPLAGTLVSAAQRGLRAPAGRHGRAGRRPRERSASGLRGRRAAPPRRCRAGLGVALPDRRDRARRGVGARPVRVRAEPRHRAPAASTGASRRRCSCAARPPRRSTGWIRRSSSTPTRSTSRSGSRSPAGTRSTCRRRVAIHHEQLVDRRAADARGSSSTRADATATCASTTACSPRSLVRVLSAWTYALRALAALGAPGPRPAALPRARGRGAGALRAARGSPRRPSATTPSERRAADGRH